MKGKLLFPIILFCLFSFPVQGFCNLRVTIQKYLHSTISASSLKKIAQYNTLIDYYASYAFFRPHDKINPDFIRALILAESSCNPKAVSDKNAVGLCQIRPATAKQAGLELAQTDFPFLYVDRYRLMNLRKKDLFDPAINILLTCYLISKYNYEYNGRLDLVLTAWNAGDNTASLHAGQPAPYPETAELIGKVNGYYIFLLDRN